MITIHLNDNAIEINRDFNILQLLEHINSPQNGIAVAINNTIVLKNSWALKTLSENDRVLIIQATQGG
jgi:sulfur carrier protein